MNANNDGDASIFAHARDGWTTHVAFGAARKAVANGNSSMVLIEREHLVEILSEVDKQDELAKEAMNCEAKLRSEIATSRPAPPSSRWIPTHERVPDDRRSVLVWVVRYPRLGGSRGGPAFSKYNKTRHGSGCFDIDGMDWFGSLHVTHWMDLDPPKEPSCEAPPRRP